MDKPIITTEFSSGKADSKWRGPKGSFAEIVGVDYQTQPGAITVHQAFSKHSGSNITELCKVALSLSDGSRLWFSSTSGKIWREIGGVYTLVYTTAPSAGSAGCSGAIEYNGYIFWATQSRLHRTAITDAATFISVDLNWKNFSVTDPDFHPMAINNQTLFIGDGHVVVKVDSSFSATMTGNLDIVAPLRIRCLQPFDIDMLIGTYTAANVNEAHVIRWDTIQTSFQFDDFIPENGIRAIVTDGELYLIIAGSAGRIYYYDGQRTRRFGKRFPGTFTNVAYYDVNPNAIGMFGNRILLGISNGSGGPLLEGVYSIGSYSSSYPRALSLDYPISSGALVSVQIGAILVDGLDVYASWYDGTNYGVDKLDYSTKYASAYLETLNYLLSSKENDEAASFSALYESLNGGSLAFSFKPNHGAYAPLTVRDDAIKNVVEAEYDRQIGRVGQFKLAFTVSGNNAPVVEAITIT